MAVGLLSLPTTNRYKPPPQKQEALDPRTAVVRSTKPGNDTGPEAEHLPSAGKKPTIVTSRRAERSGNADVPEMTPGEHQRRGDAADALFRELVRRAMGPDPQAVRRRPMLTIAGIPPSR